MFFILRDAQHNGNCKPILLNQISVKWIRETNTKYQQHISLLFKLSLVFDTQFLDISPFVKPFIKPIKSRSRLRVAIGKYYFMQVSEIVRRTVPVHCTATGTCCTSSRLTDSRGGVFRTLGEPAAHVDTSGECFFHNTVHFNSILPLCMQYVSMWRFTFIHLEFDSRRRVPTVLFDLLWWGHSRIVGGPILTGGDNPNGSMAHNNSYHLPYWYVSPMCRICAW